ncbi:hypothetical protein HanIR_Chr14g0704141 [Helianthus annuus]|nr:hypothetical protein HanIR_Chr14g0704141 [Helianthus annuus]
MKNRCNTLGSGSNHRGLLHTRSDRRLVKTSGQYHRIFYRTRNRQSQTLFHDTDEKFDLKSGFFE